MTATRSDLTPKQGAALDSLPATWKVTSRYDSDALTQLMSMAPNPYSDPPVFVIVTDPTGIVWRVDRAGNLKAGDERISL